MQTGQASRPAGRHRRLERAARRAASALLRRAPAQALGWLPVAVLRLLLMVAAGRLPGLLLGAALGAGLLGCGVTRDDAEALLGRGQPTAALRELQAEEADLAHRGASDRARYALVRGLVHLSLADRVAAGWWLAQASEIVIVAPASLGPEDRARLEDALQGLARGP